jgi:hypothetical protein
MLFLIAPVAIILVAENLGHIKAIGAMRAEASIASWAARFWETVWPRLFPPSAAAPA